MNTFAPQTIHMSIRIFETGGTFDKEFNEITGQLFFKETHLPEMIEYVQPDISDNAAIIYKANFIFEVPTLYHLLRLISKPSA